MVGAFSKPRMLFLIFPPLPSTLHVMAPFIHVPACFHLFQGIFRSHQGNENCQSPLYSEVQEAFSFLMLDHSVAFQNLRLFVNISAPLTLLTLSSHDSSPPPLPSLLTVLHRGLPSSVRLTVSTAPYLFP